MTEIGGSILGYEGKIENKKNFWNINDIRSKKL